MKTFSTIASRHEQLAVLDMNMPHIHHISYIVEGKKV